MMSLPDIMQWADVNKKTGTLTVKHQDVTKAFYLQDGKIVFVSSQKEGERLGEFFAGIGQIEEKKIKAALIESQKIGVPFTKYLIAKKIIKQETLEQGIEKLAQTIFCEAMKWEEGTFEFTDNLPPLIINGYITLNTSFVVFQSVKLYDEANRETE